MTSKTRGTTPRGRVRFGHPKAYAFHWADGWVIHDGELRNDWLSATGHKSQAAAWRDADARRQKRVARNRARKGIRIPA